MSEKMNKRVKKKWLWWLRSGRYDQARTRLLKEDMSGNASFCCLGVLCNIHAEETGKGYWEHNRYYSDGASAGGVSVQLPSEVVDWAGLSQESPRVTDSAYELRSLANMNDNGMTFDEIADIIEEQL